MQLQVRIWSDTSGRVSKVQLVNSTGDSALDEIMRSEVLGSLVLKQPPPKDMPMPIVMKITERKQS
jgi:outer membrane biosynthesis protein TonB